MRLEIQSLDQEVQNIPIINNCRATLFYREAYRGSVPDSSWFSTLIAVVMMISFCFTVYALMVLYETYNLVQLP